MCHDERSGKIGVGGKLNIDENGKKKYDYSLEKIVPAELTFYRKCPVSLCASVVFVCVELGAPVLFYIIPQTCNQI